VLAGVLFPRSQTPLNCLRLCETLMIADIHRPDISTLLSEHFYFGWTENARCIDRAPYNPYPAPPPRREA
jgi:hypothetical protein